jgi:Asp-tRNA(Asn)/Glu-tRNA(Gln) amidotransferase A subunit family amidase
MTRTLEDAVAVFQTTVGEDPDDPVTLAAPYVNEGPRPQARPAIIPDYRAALVRDGLRGARIGILRQATAGLEVHPQATPGDRAAYCPASAIPRHR